MELVNLSLSSLREAPWNPNRMDEDMLGKLIASISSFGLVENLVVRLSADNQYEVLSGNQRLQVLHGLSWSNAPCVVVDLDDAHARLLAQALNRIQGEDDLGMKAELVRELLDSLPQDEVMDLLPETSASLGALASLGHEELAEQLQAWEKSDKARLKHLQFQLIPTQIGVVEKAIERMLHRAKEEQGESPNVRGTAIFLICKMYLESEDVS